MPRLHAYWIKEFLKFFSIIQTLILVLFVFIDYLSRMGKFIKYELSLFEGLEYVLLKIPYIFVQVTPAAILLASLVLFGLMNRNNELVILKSSGINDFFLLKPALVTSVALLILMFFLGETLVPVTMAKANYIRYYLMKKRDKISVSRKDIWIKSDRKLIHINHYDSRVGTIAGVTITELDEAFRLKTRVDAKKGHFIDGHWHFKNVLVQTHEKGSRNFESESFDQKIIQLEMKPDDLTEVSKKTDEMSFFELRKYTGKVRSEGYDASSYETDMHAKIAFPFICIIMIFTGAITGMRPLAKKSIPIAVAVGVVIAFLYWFVFGFSLSLGYAGVLPPVVAAWMTNLFFVALGLVYAVYNL